MLLGYESQIAGDKALREDALRVMAGRREWAKILVDFVNEWKVPARHFSVDIVRQLSLHKDADIDAAIEKHWKGLLVTGPTPEKKKEAGRIKAVIKAALSPRHVPNGVFQVEAIPRTLSGKKMELPVKKLLMGADPARVLNPDAMANADSVAWFVDFARHRVAAS